MADEPQEQEQDQHQEHPANGAGAAQAPAPEAGPTGGAGGAGDDSAAAAGGRIEHDLEELQTKAAQRDEYPALAQRAQADFENYRKRMSRDVAAAEGRGMAKVVKELLPALDNLERAI